MMSLSTQNIVNCCKGCKDRYVGCHGKCEAYIEQRKALSERNKQIADYNSKEREYYDFKVQKIIKENRNK